MLVVENLQKRFGKVLAVRGVSFSVGAGEIFAFLGPNGAGKTTTIKMIAGLLTPDFGAVRIEGQDPHAASNTLRLLGAVLEGNRNLYWRLTAFENLCYFTAHKGVGLREARRRALAILERFGLAAKKDVQVQRLSRGMQQKVAIAVSVVHRPSVLLLDEPTLGLDVLSARNVLELIRDLRSEGVAIVLTTHQLDTAEELADRIAIIRDGMIVKQSEKQTLIEEFSGERYEIRFDGELAESQRTLLVSRVSASLYPDRISLPDDVTADLYTALEILKPVRIVSVQRARADLTSIFLRLTETRSDASPVHD